MNFGFIIDNRKCIGCHACTVACKAEHDVPIGVNRTWVKYIEKGSFPDTRRIFSVMRCNHCEDAPCVEICPTSALFTREDGIVDFDNRRCIGCKACTQACPYDALYIDPETHTAAKCNYCAHRTDLGLEPACVNVCPTQAIISGDMDNPLSNISKMLSREQTTVRKPEKNTKPNLFYIEGDEVSLTPLASEIRSEYFWSEQSKGVGHNVFSKGNQGLNLKLNPNPGLNESQPNRPTTSAPPLSVSSGYPLELQRAASKTVGEPTAKRVYDSPAKGVLWNWEVVGYIFTKALSVGVFLIPLMLSVFGWADISPATLTWASLISMAFLILTGVLLVIDLDRPDRFLYVMLRPHWTSWLVKGAYCILGYGFLLSVWILANFVDLPLAKEVQGALSIPLIVFGFMTAIYTAFLFAQAKGRDFWQNPMTFFHMFNHALVSGACALLVMDFLLNPGAGSNPVYSFLLVAGLIFGLFSALSEIFTPHATEDVERTMKIITEGHYKNHFWFGSLLFGNVLPLSLLLFANAGAVPVISALLATAGLLFAIRVWLIAPQLNPLS